MKIAIVGYGNLGKGAERAAQNAAGIECIGIFSRRENIRSESGVPIYPVSRLFEGNEEADVLLLCGGSFSDLPKQTAFLAKRYNVIDTFDDHENAFRHFCSADRASRAFRKTALVSCGWDPGLFSIAKLFGEEILPNGRTYVFWGKGVSQGHSQAIKKIDGVKRAAAYTVFDERAYADVIAGKMPELTKYASHRRECFVVVEEGADRARIAQEIKSIPHYFQGYETSVGFISEADFEKDHASFPHGGKAIRCGQTPSGSQFSELSLRLSSNPEFTGAILVAYARAVKRLSEEGRFGAYTVLDIPPSYLCDKDREKAIKAYI